MNAPPKPYERFLQSLPTRIDAPAGKPRATVFERLRQEFRAACPNSSAGQYGQAMKAIRGAIQ